MVVLNHIEVFAAFVGAFFGVMFFCEPSDRAIDLLKVVAFAFFAWIAVVAIKWEFVL